MSSPLLPSVLSRFPDLGEIRRIDLLNNAGGFSGSQLWKVAALSGDYCLRRWPAETNDEHLAFIHAFQRHLCQSGIRFVSAPIATRDATTIVERDGRLWDLCTWMPGEADYHEKPSPARLAAAMRALAQIHIAAAQMPGQSRMGTSPGIAARREQLRQLLSGGIDRIEAAVSRRSLAWDDLALRICQRFRALALEVERELTTAATISGPLFPCLRDIWHDHVLFTGDEVTGIIDFGAARIESPAGDVARLVGSLVSDDADGWRGALAAYEETRRLDAKQRQLIRAFDTSGSLLSGINWLTWLYVEEREFEDAAAVTRRLGEIAGRAAKM